MQAATIKSVTLVVESSKMFVIPVSTSRNSWCRGSPFVLGRAPLSVLPPLGLSWLYLTAVARALLAVNYKTTSVRLRRQQVHSTVAEGLPGRKNWASDFLLIICSLVIGRLSLCWYVPPFCQRSRVLITMPSRQVKHFYLDNWQSGKKTQDQVCDIIWQQHISINYSHFDECYQHLRFVSFGSSLLQLRTSPVKAKLLLDTE